MPLRHHLRGCQERAASAAPALALRPHAGRHADINRACTADIKLTSIHQPRGSAWAMQLVQCNLPGLPSWICPICVYLAQWSMQDEVPETWPLRPGVTYPEGAFQNELGDHHATPRRWRA